MKDFVLEMLVRMAEEENIEHDVTLLVGGFLVSGFVTTTDKYLQHHPTLKAGWTLLQENKTTTESKQPDAAPSEINEDRPDFIHLRNAKYFVPGQPAIPGNADVYCRIALNAVHGFSFGKLSAAD